MNLARFSVNRPVTVGIISVALVILGLFYLQRMPVSLYPDVSFPFVSVSVVYPGASAEQIEAKIVKPLEAEVSGIKRLSRVISSVRPGFANVILAFKMSANESESVDAVREKVSIVKGQFPTGAKEPVVRRVDVGATPVLIYGVETNESPLVAKKNLDEVLVRVLQRVDGVNEVKILGLGKEQLELNLDARKLSSLRVAPLDVFQGLNFKMAVTPWGETLEQNAYVPVARKLLPATPEFWENETLALSDGRSLRLGEIGKVTNELNADVDTVLINGKRGLGLVITKRSDANTVETVHRVEKVLQSISLPEGTKLFPIVNQASFVEENAHEVWIALFVGGLFAVLIILLFLTDVQSALISATALPVSVAGSFIFMSMFGFSLNQMSLLALSLAIGLLIDDAVVVRESIYSEMEHGMSGKEAAVKGTDKVASAVLATTLAVLAVFLPVGMMDGIVGQFFKQFGITICISVVLSMWVAFTLDPMLSAYVAGKPKPLKGRFWDSWRSLMAAAEVRIGSWGHYSFKHPWVVLLVALLALVGSTALIMRDGADFLAFEDRGQFVVSIRSPVGSTRETSEVIVQDAVNRLQGLDGLKDVYATVGDERDPIQSEIRLVFSSKTQRKTGLLDIQRQASKRLEGLSAEYLVMDPPPIEGIGSEAPVSMYIYGEELNDLRVAAEGALQKLKKLPGISNARIQTAALGPAMDIDFKSEDLGAQGATLPGIEGSGRLALTGMESGSVGPDNIPFIVRFAKPDRNMNAVWEHLLVPTQRGPMFIKQFANVSNNIKATQIDREKRSRKMVVWATMDRTQTFGTVLAGAQKIVDDLPKPFRGEMGGDKEIFEEMVQSFALAIIGSLFFIYLILAIQFENLLLPFVILLSLPLAIIGGFVALVLAGQQLALGALIGLVLLIGLAAKNGILLVDSIGTLKSQMSLSDAVRESVRVRSRPILMTSIAMIFGMIPTAILRGDGSEFRSPMAIAIIGGVISSTMLSFFVVPAVFGVIGRMRQKNTDSINATPVSTPIVALLLLVGSVLPVASEGFASTANIVKFEPVAMIKFLSLVRDMPVNAPEKLTIESAENAAAAGLKSSRLSVLGGARLEVGREWSFPGVTNTFAIPFFDPTSGQLNTITSSTIIQPKAANVVSFGWQIPIFNLQVFAGLELAQNLQEVVPLVQESQLESVTLASTQALMQAELAFQAVRLQTANSKISESRYQTVLARRKAGIATRLEEFQAEALRRGASVQLEQSKSQMQVGIQGFQSLSGKKFPMDGVGVPDFPFKGTAPFDSVGVKALSALAAVQNQNAEVTETSAYPTVAVELGYQGKFFDGRTVDPQKVVGVKATWNILDAGARVRQTSQNQQVELDLLAKKAQLEMQLRGQYQTLLARHESAIKSLESARLANNAAAIAQSQAADALKAGVARINDVRDADELKLKSDFVILQLNFALQGIAIESLVLTGQWVSYLKS